MYWNRLSRLSSRDVTVFPRYLPLCCFWGTPEAPSWQKLTRTTKCVWRKRGEQSLPVGAGADPTASAGFPRWVTPAQSTFHLGLLRQHMLLFSGAPVWSLALRLHPPAHPLKVGVAHFPHCILPLGSSTPFPPLQLLPACQLLHGYFLTAFTAS